MPSATAPATRPVERIAGAADPPPPGGIVVPADDPGPRIRTGRGGTARASTVLGEPQTLSLSDFAADTDGQWPAAAETRRGGALAGETAAGGVGGSPGSPTGRGGWPGHDFRIAVQATISDDEIGNLSIPLALSIGHAAGTDPAPVAGSAARSGVMVGTDASATASRAHRIRGDADIAIADLPDPGIGVAFTGIEELDGGGARGDMTGSGIPPAGGSFATGSVPRPEP